MKCKVLLLTFFIIIISFNLSEAQMVPGIYVFGDSLVDVGNNNYLKLSLAKADLPHYGIDFPNHKASGRFTNGMNAADFLAEKVGLPTSPPYFSLVDDSNNNNNVSFLKGVSFASGGARILDGTDPYVRLYNFGARKFVIVGIGTIGCCPARRRETENEECRGEINFWSVKYNKGLISMLQELKFDLKDIHYSFFDTYKVLLDFIQRPATYGFVEVKAACCGLGTLNAEIFCLPIAAYCSNRRDYIFFDRVHPTEAAHRIFVDLIFDGSLQYTFPMNVKQLVAI
ncbi:hypothetical protein ACB094_06G036000 [Castanea mollissima]